MRILISLIAVLALIFTAWAGVKIADLKFLFGVVIPYAAIVFFIIGFIVRVVKWASSPVPFRIPTTRGQQKSLPWINYSRLGNPSCTTGVIGRMFLEIFLFRSLFLNLRTEATAGQRVVYGSYKWLWLAGLAFHYSFLAVLVRHAEFFLQPVPFFVEIIKSVDGFFDIGVPRLFLTGAILVVSITYLFIRRIIVPQVRYISLAADYFPLLLIIGIAVTGMLMRYVFMVDLVGVKTLAIGLLSLKPAVPEGIGTIFYVHFFLVSALLVYFPLGKLMHMGGVFLSPTINMANNSRAARHENPWNYPVHVHTYEEYENDFRDKMKEAGIPVDKEV